ncbi:glucan phosphoethanolaminetransferase (alkaline phosphatase superfamily) [Dysgonomonas alginatilytica]|uniref:Glucan phosphoethanolaminetransferase (Alkaline phosphatase superfamily) n=1 Tax=Dysgonomonas alginatilytica TaxID=1605892 RepID=A0A2V3PNI3_9BACT|nr:phosphoethanolamine transferase [Dysgonomonas alginatilytica]PXV63362.1 glucan phosphoethanolaminetransferase (alkaline phosphatase superfamily) [Dysgonomonas alginatilytica]
MLTKAKDFLLKYPATLLTAILLFCCCIYAPFGDFAFFLKLVSVYFAFWAFINVLAIISILYLISRIPKVRILFVLLFTLLLTIEITHLLAFDSRITFGVIASMFETNAVEATDVLIRLSSYALPVSLITFFLFFRTSKELIKCKLSGWVFLSILTVCVIVLPSILVVRDAFILEQRKTIFTQDPLYFIQEKTSHKLPLVYGPLVAGIAYWDEVRKFNEFVDMKRVLPDGVKLEAEKKTPQTVYVLIGESSLSTHYSLYGYNIPTTPWLDSMKRDRSLYNIDAFSPAAQTRDAVKMSLSFAVPTNQQPFFENFNALELANLAGYETYWISNQDKVGAYDSSNGLIAASAVYSEFHNYSKDDLDLIPIVDSLYDRSKYQAFFIHLKGSHLNYPNKSDEIDKRIDKYYNESNKDPLMYDRSISHTDRVLEKLYNSVLNRNDSASALIYYYSDHGEIIHLGHGFLNHGIEQFLIPFIVIPVNDNLDISGIITPYLNDGLFNSVNFINVFAQSIGYAISEKNIEQARKDGLTLYHVDRKVYNFNDIKK